MWYVIKVSELSELRAIAWNGDLKQGYVACMIDAEASVLSLSHRAARSLASAMNAEIKRAI